MANPRQKDKNEDEEEKWTLMFYFASDNPLAPNVVTQLKAMTNAGFHQNVNVVCHFDPQTEGTDTHVFDVNLVNKLIQKTVHPTHTYKFWGENDTFIRNLVFDKLWSEHDEYPDGTKIRQQVGEVLRNRYEGLGYDPPDPTKRKNGNRPEVKGKVEAEPKPSLEPGPKASLEAFLKFCAESYRADRYMLFILGHGLVVGNDMFLYDDNAEERSLSLKNLAAVLERFTDWTDKKLDLISFHSCSMSSIEVGYELRDSAKHMLASQGPAFVGSWPYREILTRLFTDKISREKRGEKPPSVRSSIEKIFTYVLRYSYDFQLAGYSFDLCLSNLDAVDQITSRLHALATCLTSCLKKKERFVKEAILLAHWDAQSFWQESYTDLYDFCFCLKRRCEEMSLASAETKACLKPIIKKCEPIIAALESDLQRIDLSEGERVGNGTIVRTAFAGPKYQYAHGLSVYFPWAQPSNDFFWQTEYKKKYAFVHTGWAEFLQTYFDETQREPVREEVKKAFGSKAVPQPDLEEILLEEITCKVFNPRGPLNHSPVTGGGDGQSGSDQELNGGGDKPGGDSGMGDEKPGGDSGMGDEKPGGDSGMGDEKPGGDSGMGGGKPGGDSGAGGDCDCPGIKNYPSFTRARSKGKDPEDKAAKPTSTEFFRFLIKEES
jgi:hypothetical protein